MKDKLFILSQQTDRYPPSNMWGPGKFQKLAKIGSQSNSYFKDGGGLIFCEGMEEASMSLTQFYFANKVNL